MIYESIAEQRAYPIISLVAHALGCKLDYQRKIFLETLDRETYRIDFVLESKEFKIAVEIDGVRFHNKNSSYELFRDRVLFRLGYLVVHIPAKEIFREKISCLERILTAIHVDRELVKC